MDIFDEQGKKLIQALLELKNAEELQSFLIDICTIHEIQILSQRFHVATLLKKKLTYDKICEMTGASKATISRVNRALMWGENGYALAMMRLEEGTQEVENEFK